jgi:hypothetical protein
MISKLEWRLKQFVDRDREMEKFCGFLDTNEKLVTAVVGPAGIGKSSLKDRMVHECSLRKVAKVEIVYTDDNLPEYMAIMRKCRDDLGAERFSRLTDRINYYTDPRYVLEVRGSNVNVANEMVVTGGAVVGDVSGVVIRDSMITFPRADLNVEESERRTTLTHLFLTDLGGVAKKRTQIVIFVDGAEKMNEGTARWLWDVVIPGLPEVGATNVRVVFFGREEPKLADGWTQEVTDLTRLAPLALCDIELYMEKRGIGPEHRGALAAMVFANSEGNPLKICNLVDGFVAFQKQQDAA